MRRWSLVLVSVLPVVSALLLLLLLLVCLFRQRRGGYGRRMIISNESRLRLNKGPFESNASCTYTFQWNRHPSLIAEAVEQGWTAFAFRYICPSSSVAGTLSSTCTSLSQCCAHTPEISWQVVGGSDYLQKLWLNPGLIRKKEKNIGLVQVLRTALPLPGPELGPNFFPSEGYFEITVLAEGVRDRANATNYVFSDNEHEKLIFKHFLSVKRQTSEQALSQHSTEMFDGQEEQKGWKSEQRYMRGIEFSKFAVHGKASLEEEYDIAKEIAIGLTVGDAPSSRLPGLDAGSVGFHSSGRIYLNGAMRSDKQPEVLVLKHTWDVVNSTVGCGFNPATKKVFFTVNGEHAYEFSTTISEFGYPLFPVVAANYDVMLLANFGQSSFEYAPANFCRVPDPSFKWPMSTRTPKSGTLHEDSGDLFSMGRIDSHWHAEIDSPVSDDLQHHHVLSEAESDLFEIILDIRS